MVSDERLNRYAAVLVKIGLRIEPGDRLLVRAGTHAMPLVRHVTRHAYREGAVNVDVLWVDDEIERARFMDGPADAAGELPYESVITSRAGERGDSYLRIVGEAPDRMAGVDADRLAAHMRKVNSAVAGFMGKLMSLEVFWTAAAAPSPEWATLVFPDLSEEAAVDALWDAVLATVRVDEPDPIAAWERHLDHLDARMAYLDERRFDRIRYRGPGTDLTVGLPSAHRWNHPGEGSRGRRNVANLPTEEVSTSPHRDRAEGTIRATKPLSYQGRLLEGLEFRFAGGAVVEARAESGQEDLDRILDSDEGVRRLGEVALVPQSSLVAMQNLTWYQTLIDENDASHLALGAGYPMGIRGGMEMTPEQLSEVGLNRSALHVDFVVGSTDLVISGVRTDGTEEPLLVGGEWAFEV